MASREELLQRLAKARRVRAANVYNSKPHAPATKPTETPPLEVVSDPQRELASACAKDAMIMGWERSIQKHAAENHLLVYEMENVLDKALEYNDKADPSGRIPELEDYKQEKQGRSRLAPKRQ